MTPDQIPPIPGLILAAILWGIVLARPIRNYWKARR